MTKAIILAISTVMAAAGMQDVRRESLDLSQLTVPQEHLPAGCVLSRANSERLGDGRVRTGLWGGLPIPTNPWSGTDRNLVALIHERMGNGPRTPDGPPLTSREAARFRSTAAEGIEEAYAAAYTQPGHELVLVHASRFSGPARPGQFATHRLDAENPRIVQVTIGSVVAVVSGEGSCFRAVGAHVRSLAN